MVLDLIALTQEIDTGEEGKEGVQRTLPGEKRLPFGLLHPRPSRLPRCAENLVPVGEGETALGHVVEQRSLAPGKPGILVQLGPAGQQCRIGGKILVVDDPRHAAFHMVEQVAVEEPITGLVGIEFNDRGGHRRHIHGVLERRPLILPAVQHPEEVAVQVHGMVHHGAVDHDEAGHLAPSDRDDVVRREGGVVHLPDIALHVAVQGETDLANGLALGEGGGLGGAKPVVGRPGTVGGHAVHGQAWGSGGIGAEQGEVGRALLAVGVHHG